MKIIETDGRPTPEPLRLVRKRELARLLGVDPSTIVNWVKSGTFPQRICLNPNGLRSVIAWRQSDIDE